ncbi:MAG: BrnT family toxin [Bacteroidetes bacterium]|nr:BrnT family toxin [Bacteroidota bacterium]
MATIEFEWDEEKARTNLKKHRISFPVAARVFADPHALTIQDRIEDGEYRWQTLGLVNGQVVVMVAHTSRFDENDAEVVRIISARRAEQKERKRYEQNRSS